MATQSPFARRIAPPTLRYETDRGYYPVIPGTPWGYGTTRKYFTDEVSARIWARQTWCTQHHRVTCPPILLDTSVSGSLHDPRFIACLQRIHTNRLERHHAVPIPQATTHGLVSDAWNPSRLAATREGGAPPEFFQHWAWESDDPDDAHDDGPDYAGWLLDNGTVQFPVSHVVYLSPAVNRDVRPVWHDGRAHYDLDTQACLLWALRDRPAESDDAIDASSSNDPIIVYGAFLSSEHARNYAIDTLHAEYVIPRVSPWVLSLDAKDQIPLRLMESNASLHMTPLSKQPHSVQAWLRQAATRGVVRPLHTDKSTVGVWLVHDDGQAEWWEQAPGVPYQWPATIVSHPKFQAWARARRLAVAKDLLPSTKANPSA